MNNTTNAFDALSAALESIDDAAHFMADANDFEARDAIEALGNRVAVELNKLRAEILEKEGL